jgi:hypothetical protein
MEVIVQRDSKYLIPNAEHKNFTESNDWVGEGNYLKGNYADIEGLRRGEPFTYKLFITEDKKILFRNNVQPMQTEVTLGADSQTSETIVNLIPAETFNKVKTAGIILGAIAGYGYSKYKNHDIKKMAMFIFGGAVVGYATSFVVDKNKKAIVTPSK